MKLIKTYDVDLSEEWSTLLQELLVASFPEVYPKDRLFFKQIPQGRVLAFAPDNQLVGHVGIDYRIMNLNGKPIRVLGIIDLCVSSAIRSQGIASLLISEVERMAKGRVDFVLLFADHEELYSKNGFKTVSNTCKWLKIDHETLTTVGVGHQEVEGLMIKEVGSMPWSEGELDFLGYLY
ncbi:MULTISPECIES: GNAT family N-acetyltransferase [unclassified Paenibacillus]|uniref:GNAT family N-acetyltransferase n=1 Tax=unclassified Paenibacillus TaxID=185978 RepID=UPI000CFCD6C2|nr:MULTISPECIES: GNAT family N-acetyltransferase [unclassified Paenibacillus]PRA07297.1 GNAT family N-acetyltransferase [Paenibacillus sp. MYb63]PRA50941.1 GNAT family N-acetyltransferase [Paenibacillus sp. MYb67]QZN74073.1 GNAT family N-acetyltransferase [Paenibacillus sp. DR312]